MTKRTPQGRIDDSQDMSEMTPGERAEVVVDYLNDECQIDEPVHFLDFLDALATYGLQLTVAPGLEASATYQHAVSQTQQQEGATT